MAQYLFWFFYSNFLLAFLLKKMHSNLASFKKPKIQFSQFQDAQTPNKPVSKQATFKTTQRQKVQFCCFATSSRYEN
jgi:hypothetical protein